MTWESIVTNYYSKYYFENISNSIDSTDARKHFIIDVKKDQRKGDLSTI